MLIKLERASDGIALDTTNLDEVNTLIVSSDQDRVVKVVAGNMSFLAETNVPITVCFVDGVIRVENSIINFSKHTLLEFGQSCRIHVSKCGKFVYVGIPKTQTVNVYEYINDTEETRLVISKFRLANSVTVNFLPNFGKAIKQIPGNKLLVLSDVGVSAINLDTFKEESTSTLKDISALAQYDSTIFAGTTDPFKGGTLSKLNLETNDEFVPVEMSQKPPFSFGTSISSNLHYMAVGCPKTCFKKGEIVLFRGDEYYGTLSHNLHINQGTSLVLTRDNTLLVACDRAVAIWDVVHKLYLGSINISGKITGMAIANYGATVFVSTKGGDGIIALRKAKNEWVTSSVVMGDWTAISSNQSGSVVAATTCNNDVKIFA